MVLRLDFILSIINNVRTGGFGGAGDALAAKGGAVVDMTGREFRTLDEQHLHAEKDEREGKEKDGEKNGGHGLKFSISCANIQIAAKFFAIYQIYLVT